MRTYQGDNHTTGYLLDYPHFKEHYQMTPIYLSKQKSLDAVSKFIHKTNFTGKLDRDGNTTFFIIKKQKKPF